MRFKSCLPGKAPMKSLLSILFGTAVILSGLPPAFGFSLFSMAETQSVNRWPYSFGVHYIYDNGGSSWNYGRGFRDHHGHRLENHQHIRFSYPPKRPLPENLDGLIQHLTRHSSGHRTPYHPFRSAPYDHIGR